MYTVIGADGQPYGPVDRTTLVQWIRENRIVGSTEIVDEVTGTRTRADLMPSLGDVFSGPGSTPMPGSAPTSAYGIGTNTQTPSTQTPFQPNYSQPPTPRTAYTPMGTSMGVSSKSKVAAILLAFFLGSFGVHRFYLGHTNSGVTMLVLTLIGTILGSCLIVPLILLFVTWVWAIVDIINIATGALTDVTGEPLS